MCGNALYVAGGMGNFGAANVNDTVEVFTIDDSTPNCPLTAPAAVQARTGEPSELDPSRLPSVRRLASRSDVGDGAYCVL